ncbi:hypothetical protein F4778DRAFT_140855 [Xylariomycetidae sp. FL2044]|nr:hypothetical protein F4778DRAFT_140855 [Xylariomycetidae sp. FL2044]
MATPDTADLTSSAQVFTSYTLPQIRAIHKNLHVQIDEKSARLRTQVGNSYRELLGTADTIVHMRQDMLGAQEVLGRMGGLCGRTVVGGKVAGLGKFRGREDAELQMGQVAKVKLLKACGLSVGKLLKGASEGRGDRLVLAAKVLVLMRLLLSSFKHADPIDDDIKESVEAADKSLGRLRQRLRRAIDKVLANVDEDVQQSDILKALCAYSLASTSGLRDVLRHLLNVREEAMTYQFDTEQHGKEQGTDNVLRGLDLYTRTMLDVQSLVPNKLTQALSGLKKKPLLADEALQGLEGLRLDIYERWCGEDIQYFTPFIRHDDLDGKQAKDMLTHFVNKGSGILLDGLRNILAVMSDFKDIVELRTSVLQRWIRDGGKARGFDPSEMLDGLRKVINDHLLAVQETKVAKLKLVGSEVSATLEAWQAGMTDVHRGLWDQDILELDLSDGASQATHEILSRLYGRNDAVSRAVRSYESWHQIIDNVGELVEQLGRQRWDNDVDDIEDEEVIEARQTLLSKEDPQLLHKRLDFILEKSFRDLDEQLSGLWHSRLDRPDNGPVAMYMLRVLRDIRNLLPKLEAVKPFGLSNVPSLHEKVATHVSMSPLEEFCSSALTKKRVAGRALWEGDPALPSQPSPGAFKLLRDLVMSMGDAGLDLWTPTAVKVIKRTFRQQLADVWRKELEAIPEKATARGEQKSPSVEEDSSPEARERSSKAEEQRTDVLIQWLFDIHLLETCLGDSTDSDDGLTKLAADIRDKTGLGGDADEKLAKMSQEYWKRTSLLFGLLA